MATWSALRERLASVDDSLTMSWSELDDMVGGLPRSAYQYQAFWLGDRQAWAGFRTRAVRVGQSVTFVRVDSSAAGATMSAASPTVPVEARAHPPRQRVLEVATAPDLVLVGCVKRKRSAPAAAQDLYTSPLFRKERAYAESSGARWLILSAEHGVVEPLAQLAPYELQLSKTSAHYQREWGRRVLSQLREVVGDVSGLTIEIHAGLAYIQPIRSGLQTAGAHLVEPLAGLSLGQRLAWYGHGVGPPASAGDLAQSVEPSSVLELVSLLGDYSASMSPADVLATRGAGLARPGLYSWWVDVEGAADLTAGLGLPILPGMIYAGLAGATRAGGRSSTNTLWGRIRTMHLGGNHDFSTLRLTLGSVLAEARDTETIDEAALTMWMHEHLRLVTAPVDDRDALYKLETDVLARLDPPLNLSKMARTPVRSRLTELRRLYR